MRSLRLLTLPALLLLGGCNVVLLSPAGDVAVQQRNLVLASTALMLVIIVPVMLLTVFFAWRYRASNKEAVYDPDFHHSTALEVVIWTAPLLIIIALGAMTWMATHLLDPYRPIGRVSAAKPITSGKTEEAKPTPPLEVQVVALDWKWLFLYPEQGIAAVNELAAPVDRPIRFRLTSSSVMNSFFVPALAGQIYAMPGMETKLHAVINKAGEYDGFSANYSGAGFSRMNFKFLGRSTEDFDAWVAKVKGSGTRLDRAAYGELEKPSEAVPATHFGTVEGDLYEAILGLCTRPGKMCMHEMMAIDARGGAGRDSDANYERLRYDGVRMQEGNEAPGATFPASGRLPNTNDAQPQGMQPDRLTPQVNPGAPAGAREGRGSHDHHGGGSDRPAPTQR